MFVLMNSFYRLVNRKIIKTTMKKASYIISDFTSVIVFYRRTNELCTLSARIYCQRDKERERDRNREKII